MTNLFNRYDVELTDTFNGEANYCWIVRKTIRLSLNDDEGAQARKRYDARIKREAKAAVGLTGVRGQWSDYGDGFEFRPRGLLQVMFVTYNDQSE